MDLMWWEIKNPEGSEHASDVMKTVIKEDEMQAGQIVGRGWDHRGSSHLGPGRWREQEKKQAF